MKDKRITKLVSLLMISWNCGCFSYIWYTYYNAWAFQKYFNEGLIACLIIYVVLYVSLCKLYRAFSFLSSTAWDSVLSHAISFSISNLIMYIGCILSWNDYVSFVPGLYTTIAQVIGTAVILRIANRHLFVKISPAKTVYIYGAGISVEESMRFHKELQLKYKRMINICYEFGENSPQDMIREKLQECDKLIMYGVTPNARADYIHLCMEYSKVFYYVPDYSDIIMQNCHPKHLLDTPLMQMDYTYLYQKNAFVKRAFDIAFSLILLMILCPIMLIIAIAIRAEDHGPIFFRQERVTIDHKVFRVCKFRSMKVNANEISVSPAVKDDPRITKVGKFLRKTRLDEIPQLINILIGDMSFVGPRPEMLDDVEKHETQVSEFKYRCRVKAGLTGYAQVYGKYNTSPEDKLKLDLLYIQNQSIVLDLKLILLTIRVVFEPDAAEAFEKEEEEHA